MYELGDVVMSLNKIVKGIKEPELIINYILNKKITRIIPDKTLLKIKYKVVMGKKLNLDNPQSFNEKLQWLKLYDRKTGYNKLVDKYAVRQHIMDTIGKEYLIPLMGVYDTYDEIDFNVLPNQFVLKPNHTSGDIFICKDKSQINYVVLEKQVKKWLKREYYWLHREWPYKNIKPKIICEKFMSDKETAPDDYKILCFHGKAKLIEVHIDRYGDHKQDFYDAQWNKTKLSQEGTNSELIYEKPQQLKEMIQLSEQLSANMAHVRIDWYIVEETLYFGEITFFDGAGFTPFENEEDDYLLGSWITLPVSKKSYEGK